MTELKINKIALCITIRGQPKQREKMKCREEIFFEFKNCFMGRLCDE